MRGSTAIRPATCVPSVLAAFAPAMWGRPSAPSCTITTAPARDGAQSGASWAVLHPAPHQLVSEHHDLRCLRRPVPAHSGSRRGVGQARRRAPPARDGAQPRACGLWCTLLRTQLGKRARCCPSCWPSHVGVLGPMRYGRHGHAMHARRAGARQKCRRAAHQTPACGGGGAPVLVPHTQYRPTVATQATRLPRRHGAVADKLGAMSLRRCGTRLPLHAALHAKARFWPAAACGGL